MDVKILNYFISCKVWGFVGCVYYRSIYLKYLYILYIILLFFMISYDKK